MPTERLIIVGAGGFGRELFCWAADCHEAGLLPPLRGFIADTPSDVEHYDVENLGSIAEFQPSASDRFLIAIGSPEEKKAVAEKLRDRGGKFASLIHPSAVVARSAILSEGAILCPLSLVSADARLGRLVTVNALSSVGHDVTIGDFSTLSAHVDLTGFVSLGECVLVGSGAKVLPKVKIGDGATIGSGSTVYRSVRPGATVYAAPAKAMNPSSADASA